MKERPFIVRILDLRSVGSRSLLFGVHQMLWHPITVAWAWRKLYGRWPNRMEAFCILVHDLGYCGVCDMDGPEGQRHPVLGAQLAGRVFGHEAFLLCIGHSRSYARMSGAPISPLCAADKLAVLLDVPWVYLPRAILSGEIREYREVADRAGFIPKIAPHGAWYRKLRAHEMKKYSRA